MLFTPWRASQRLWRWTLEDTFQSPSYVTSSLPSIGSGLTDGRCVLQAIISFVEVNKLQALLPTSYAESHQSSTNFAFLLRNGYLSRLAVKFDLGEQLLLAPALYDSASHVLRVQKVVFSTYPHSTPCSVGMSVLSEGRTVVKAEFPLEIMRGGDSHIVYIEEATETADETIKISLSLSHERCASVGSDTDLTPIFHRKMKAAEEELSMAAADVKRRFHGDWPHADLFHILFIPGFLTNHYPLYFYESYLLLDRLDVEYSTMIIDTEGTIEANGKHVAEQVMGLFRKIRRPIVIYTHSKGGLDVLEAFRIAPEDLTRSVRAVLLLQVPYGGSPIVDILSKRGTWSLANRILGRIWQVLWPFRDGWVAERLGLVLNKTIQGMSCAARADKLREITNEFMSQSLERIFHPVIFITVACYAQFEKGYGVNLHESLGGTMAQVDEMMRQYGFKSDGLVPAPNARIPGTHVVILEGAYHTTPALHVPGGRYHAGALTQALVELTFEVLAGKDGGEACIVASPNCISSE